MRTPKAKKTVARKRRGDAPIVPGQRLLSKPQVLALLNGVAYSTVWGWMKDGWFPLPLELGPPNGRSSSIAWDANEVLGWIANRPRRLIGQNMHAFRGRGAEQPDRASLDPPAAKASPPNAALWQVHDDPLARGNTMTMDEAKADMIAILEHEPQLSDFGFGVFDPMKKTPDQRAAELRKWRDEILKPRSLAQSWQLGAGCVVSTSSDTQ